MKSWLKVLMCVAVSGMSIFAGCNNPKEEEQGGSESQFFYQNTNGHKETYCDRDKLAACFRGKGGFSPCLNLYCGEEHPQNPRKPQARGHICKVDTLDHCYNKIGGGGACVTREGTCSAKNAIVGTGDNINSTVNGAENLRQQGIANFEYSLEATAGLADHIQRWATGNYRLAPGYVRCDRAKLYACGVAKRGAMCGVDQSICSPDKGALVCHEGNLSKCMSTRGHNGGGGCVNVQEVCRAERPGAAQ